MVRVRGWVSRVGGQVRVGVHLGVVALVVSAVVVALWAGDGVMAAGYGLALVFYVVALRAGGVARRAERAARESAAWAEQAQVLAIEVCLRAEQVADRAVAAAVQNLPQDKADELMLQVVALREGLD